MRNVRELVDAIEAGRRHTAHFRKLPVQITLARQWADLSMVAGNPVPNYYASTPLVAATLDGSRGLFHGDDKAPSTKRLTRLAICGNTAGTVGKYRLMDYLLYYPFIDLDDTSGEQVMSNPVTLPRYEDGDGVKAVLIAVAPTVGGGSFEYSYIDSQGNPQTSGPINMNASVSAIGVCPTFEAGNVGAEFFLPIANSRGIRSVTGFNVIAGGGGLGALVLVRPITDLATCELNAVSEAEFVSGWPGAPRVLDGAYLNFMLCCGGSFAGASITGSADFVWD